MRFVRDDAGNHQRFAEMHGRVIAPIADRLAYRHGLGSLPRCLDRNQTEIEDRPQASKAPEPYPPRREWIPLQHCPSIVSKSRKSKQPPWLNQAQPGSTRLN